MAGAWERFHLSAPEVMQLSGGTGRSVHRLTPMRGRPGPCRALRSDDHRHGATSNDGDTPTPCLSVENDIELVKSFYAMRSVNFPEAFGSGVFAAASGRDPLYQLDGE